MFIRIAGRETIKHVCQGKKPQNMATGIYKHDLRAYMMQEKKFIDIKFCPFCGCNLDTDMLDNTVVINE